MTDESIFATALAIPAPADRAAYLDQVCAGNPTLRREIEELLAAHAASNLLDAPPRDVGRTGAYVPPDEAASTATAGDHIGAYKLLQRIGEGGMGEVWVADQHEPLKRRVALKLIKPGMDSRGVLARFEAERQALALMDHPNIAKVLDAGATPDGRPFFVMELVKGTPITEFCDERKLTPRQRLELFVPVCSAIQHAHQKGVIHRDIKPSNVLVALHDETPVVKVIDFGVAKAIGQQLTERTIYTGFGAIIGTPAYMAPEQATFNQLDVDTRADVYALGVLLYELLVGSPPVEPERLKRAALDEILRIVRDEEPPRPSQRLSTSQAKATIAATRQSDPAGLSALMKGEIDWIVMKALEKDRARRYDTPTALAKDVQRYLTGDAVEACPPTLGYRLRKMYRKNRTAVVTAAAFAAVLLVATGVSVTYAAQAKRAADIASEATKFALGENERAMAAAEEAQTQAREAARQRDETKAALGKFQRAQEEQQASQYVWDMQTLPLVIEANNVAEANRLLDRHAPQPGQRDRRGFEWFFWERRIHPELRTDRLPDVGAAHGFWATSSDGTRVARFMPPKPEDMPPNDAPTVTVWDVTTRKVLFTHRMPIKKPLYDSYVTPNPVRPQFSRDGKRVVVEWGFLAAQQGAQQLRQVLEVSTGKVLLALDVEKGGRPPAARDEFENRLSPDGRRFAFVSLIPGKELPAQPGRRVCVWDVDSGKEACSPLEADGLASSPFSPDGALLVTRKGARVSVWDIDNNRERVGWDIADGTASALAVSPDGTRVAATIAKRTTPTIPGRGVGTKGANPALEAERGAIWSLETGKELHALTFPGLSGTGARYTPRVFFSPNGTRLVIERLLAPASGDRPVSELAIWDTTTGKARAATATADTSGAALRSMRGTTFSPDSKQLICADGNVLRTWEVDTGKPVLALRGHLGPIGPCGYSPDGQRLWSLEDSGVLKEWGSRSNSEVTIRFANTRADNPLIPGFAISPDGSHVASLIDVRTEPAALAMTMAVRVWDASGKSVGILTPPPYTAPKSRTRGPFYGLALSRDGKRAVLTRAGASEFDKDEGASPSDLTVWDVESKAVLLHQQFEDRHPPFVAISPDGRTVAVVGITKRTASRVTIKTFDVDTRNEKSTLAAETTGIYGLSFSPDGRRIAGLCVKMDASVGKNSTSLVVWDLASGSPCCTLEAEPDGPIAFHSLATRLAWAPGGSRFAFAHGRRGEVASAVYETATGKKLLTLEQPLAAEPGAYNHPHFTYSPDGKRIAAFLVPWLLGGTPVLKVWDAESGKEQLTLRTAMSGRGSAPKSLTFADSGHRLLLTELTNDPPLPGTGAATSSGRSLVITAFDATPVARERKYP